MSLVYTHVPIPCLQGCNSRWPYASGKLRLRLSSIAATQLTLTPYAHQAVFSTASHLVALPAQEGVSLPLRQFHLRPAVHISHLRKMPLPLLLTHVTSTPDLTPAPRRPLNFHPFKHLRTLKLTRCYRVTFLQALLSPLLLLWFLPLLGSQAGLPQTLKRGLFFNNWAPIILKCSSREELNFISGGLAADWNRLTVKADSLAPSTDRMPIHAHPSHRRRGQYRQQQRIRKKNNSKR